MGLQLGLVALLLLLIALAGSTSRIDHVPYDVAYGRQFDDLPRRVPKLDRVRESIGFSKKFNLEQIIRSVIEDQRG